MGIVKRLFSAELSCFLGWVSSQLSLMVWVAIIGIIVSGFQPRELCCWGFCTPTYNESFPPGHAIGSEE